jgi:hypothetical protein
MMVNEAFDPRTGVSETMHRKYKEVKHKLDYKVVNMNRHTCTCEDRYSGLSNHTMWQWGRPSNNVQFSTQDTRPKPPAVVEEMVRMASKHLVDEVFGDKPGVGGGIAGRRYNELSRFYVVANRYEQDAAIGTHSDSNALYAKHSQQPVVISCNMVADGVLWISPTLHAIKSDVQGNRSIEWVYNKYCSRTADKDNVFLIVLKALCLDADQACAHFQVHCQPQSGVLSVG